MKKLWKDKELKNNNKRLYYYVKQYKILLFEMFAFAVLLISSLIVIQIMSRNVT